MTQQTNTNQPDDYARGRAVGFGIAALTISAVAFIQLLGAEKAIAGLVLGTLAYRSGAESDQSRKLAIAAIAVSSFYLVLMLVVLLFAGEDILHAIKALDQAT